MHAFRLGRAKYPGFDGRGTLLASGRWNDAGVHMIYTSASRALAVLEVLVHLRKGQVPPDYVFFEVDIPDASIPLPLPVYGANQEVRKSISMSWRAS